MCTTMNVADRASFRASTANIAGVRCLESLASSCIASGKDASRKTALRFGARAGRAPELLGRPGIGRDGHGDARGLDQETERRNDMVDGDRSQAQTTDFHRAPGLEQLDVSRTAVPFSDMSNEVGPDPVVEHIASQAVEGCLRSRVSSRTGLSPERHFPGGSAATRCDRCAVGDEDVLDSRLSREVAQEPQPTRVDGDDFVDQVGGLEKKPRVPSPSDTADGIKVIFTRRSCHGSA